jgi:hypothetical protein
MIRLVRHICVVSAILNAPDTAKAPFRSGVFLKFGGARACRVEARQRPILASRLVSSPPHRICRADGAEILFGLWFYKDAAPTALEW